MGLMMLVLYAAATPLVTRLCSPVGAAQVQIMLDDNEKKGTSVYRDRLYAEIAKMKKKR